MEFRWKQPGNIWSGSKTHAVLTNPTELAFRKGNLRHHYPLNFGGRTYSDLEEAYQALKTGHEKNLDLMVALIIEKFQQHRDITEAVIRSGGADFLEKCSHFCGARTARFQWWEGHGCQSPFIKCLVQAFKQIQSQ